MSFETGYTTEVIKVLIERFSEKYKQIIYSEETQEVTLLKSLEFSILKGGKPVLDLLERELAKVKDSRLIQATYEAMDDYWEQSKRKVDKDIKEVFVSELSTRKIVGHQYQSQNQSYNQNQSHSHNHNQESYSTIRTTIREDAEETAFLDRYAKCLKKSYPDLEEIITSENILCVYYRQVTGEVNPPIENQLRHWEKSFPTSLILEALSRSLKAVYPLPYAASILEKWKNAGVETYKDVVELDDQFN